MNLGVIVVNYKNALKTINFIESELVKLNVPFDLVVVDNSCDISEVEILESGINILTKLMKPIKSIKVIYPKSNIGFANANNLGSEYLIEKFNVEYLLFVNNDILFDSKYSILTLIDILSNNDCISVIGPKILGLDGKCQSPDQFINFTQRWLFRFMGPLGRFFSDREINRDLAEEGIYYRLMASILLFKSSDFLRIGMFDPNTFLYGEELILAEKLKKINKSMYYYPYFKVVHEHNQTIGKFYSEYSKTMEMFRSESYYYYKYLSVPKLYIKFAYCYLCIYFKIKQYIKPN